MRKFLLPVLLVIVFGISSAQTNVGIGTNMPLSILDINGAIGTGVKTLSTSQTLDGTAGTILANPSGGAFTITLPVLSTSSHRIYNIIYLGTPGGNAVTIQGNAAGDNITAGGTSANTFVLTEGSIILQNNGSAWYATVVPANSGSGNYIWNQNSTTQTGNFKISGTGTMGGLTDVGTANINASGSAATNIGNASSTTTVVGPINVNTSGAATTAIGNASSTTTVTGPANINTTGSAATSVGNGTSTLTENGNISLNSNNGTATTNIGTGSTTGAISIGSTTGAQTISMGNGTTVNQTVNVANGGTTGTQTVNVGSSGTTADVTNIYGGTTGGVNVKTLSTAGAVLTNTSGTLSSGAINLASSTYVTGLLPNGNLANSSITINNGTGMTGGGTVALGGTITHGLANGTAAGQVFVTGASPYAPQLQTVGQDAAIAANGNVTVQGIAGKAISGSLTSGDVLEYNGSNWVYTSPSSLANGSFLLNQNSAQQSGSGFWTAGTGEIDGNQLTMGNATSNLLYFSGAGVAAPAFTTRSAGTKIVFYPQEGTSAADYAMGINSGTLWYSVPVASGSYQHIFYGGTSALMTISGAGTVTVANLAGTNSREMYADANGVMRATNTGPYTTVAWTSSTTWTVPAGVYRIRVYLWGAGGGASYCHADCAGGGAGGYVSGEIVVTPSEVLTIAVGSGGGGNQGGGGGNGGTGSAIYRSGSTMLAAAGGGGGGSYNSTNDPGQNGGWALGTSINGSNGGNTNSVIAGGNNYLGYLVGYVTSQGYGALGDQSSGGCCTHYPYGTQETAYSYGGGSSGVGAEASDGGAGTTGLIVVMY